MKVEEKKKSNYEPIPAGTHIARIYSLVHIGTTVEDTPWGTKEKDTFRVTWELPNIKKEFKEGEGEKPMVISKFYNKIGWHEKCGMRKMVKSITGKDQPSFDTDDLMGKTCMLSVVHVEKDERTYANIDAITQLPDGVKAPKPVNEPYILDYQDNWSEEKFSTLPEFLRDMMKRSDEYGRIMSEDKGGEKEIKSEDIPF